MLGYGISLIGFEEKKMKTEVNIVTVCKMKFSVQNLYSKSGKTCNLNQSSFFCVVKNIKIVDWNNWNKDTKIFETVVVLHCKFSVSLVYS